jgi:hypothetical protein
VKFFLSLFTALLLTPVLRAADGPKPVAKPNILIFDVDDMGWAQPGCYDECGFGFSRRFCAG